MIYNDSTQLEDEEMVLFRRKNEAKENKKNRKFFLNKHVLNCLSIEKNVAEINDKKRWLFK